MTDFLERAVGLFCEICDLDEREQVRRLDDETRDDPPLRAKVEELLLGDRAPDQRLDRTAGDFVQWEEGDALDAGLATSSEVFERLSDRGRMTVHYRVGGEIARGGMGTILETWDEDLERNLAMKVLQGGEATPETIGSRRFQRFFDEARITGQLDHPGVVPVHDFGIDSRGQAYFTMKLVKGRTLEDVLEMVTAEQEGWSQTRALGILLRVCEAMAYAHDKGVVHRDLKPANVMVGRFGEVYVMDWGVAWLRSRSDHRDLRPKLPDDSSNPAGDILVGSPIVTMDGSVVGTPYYMSLEQARGDLVDERSDVFAVGAMLYALLVGRPPYCGEDEDPLPHEVLKRVLAGPPPRIHELRRVVPVELESICQKAMARKPEDRYASMVDCADDIRAYLEGRVVQAHRTGAMAELGKWVARNRALAGSIAGGVLVLVIGLAASLFYWNSAEVKSDEADRERDKALALAKAAQIEEWTREADELWPAHPRNLAAYEAWLERAHALISELGASPETSDPGVRAKIHDVRTRALPRSDAERERDRRTHPSFAALAALEARLLAWSRADDVRQGRTQPADVVLDEGALPSRSDTLNRMAWSLVSPHRAEFGREAEGLGIARLALRAARSDFERAHVMDTLAWALLSVGLDDEALDQSGLALETAGPENEGAFRTNLENLRRAIDDVASGETLASLEDEREALEAAVSTRRTWRFAREEDTLWHDAIARLVDPIESFADPETGPVDGFSARYGWGVSRRRVWAAKVEELTTTGEAVAARWDRAIASIRSQASHPMYRGIEIAPQVGLIPLGPDPESGLWEFGHPATGILPERDERGRLMLEHETGLVFVLLPGGTFPMGADRTPGVPNYTPEALANEGPVHEVTLSPFFISKYEMTQAQWKRFTLSDPSYYGTNNPATTPLHPVENVSWIDCRTVCRRLGLELPTEARWEYAARGGRTSAWWTGDDRGSLIGAANLADQAAARIGAPWPSIEDWPELDDGYGRHSPIGNYASNPFGLHDVHGNVWEWCFDAYTPDFYAGSGVEDPRNDEPDSSLRVFRGGSFRETSGRARSASRGNGRADAAQSYLGLRPARSLDY